LKIINKISINRKIENSQSKHYKENKIFGTDTEKFIIQNLNLIDHQKARIFITGGKI
jgi:hypothetical protein